MESSRLLQHAPFCVTDGSTSASKKDVVITAGGAASDVVLLLPCAGLATALISCGVPALLRGLPTPYAQQALQVLTNGTCLTLDPACTSGLFDSMTGTQICDTPELRAAVKNARDAIRKESVIVDFEDFLETFRRA
jgi:hypothetical protein